MVYSTCSMNPVENEAVVAEVCISILYQRGHTKGREYEINK